MRVVIAEDSVLLREGIMRLLLDAGLDVVASVGTAEELMNEVERHIPEIAVVDIKMPPTHTDEGLRAAKQIRSRHPDIGVLVLSQYVELGLVGELLAEGAEGLGYLLKDRVANVREFIAAVERVGNGGSALDPSIVSQLMSRRREDDRMDHLTEREREVLALMAEGMSNQAIADRLVVTVRAVEKHVSSLFDKLDLAPSPDSHRRVLAVLSSLRK